MSNLSISLLLLSIDRGVPVAISLELDYSGVGGRPPSPVIAGR